MGSFVSIWRRKENASVSLSSFFVFFKGMGGGVGMGERKDIGEIWVEWFKGNEM